ncbi:hypothetical protein [Streptomyces sp. NPDC058548]
MVTLGSQDLPRGGGGRSVNVHGRQALLHRGSLHPQGWSLDE